MKRQRRTSRTTRVKQYSRQARRTQQKIDLLNMDDYYEVVITKTSVPWDIVGRNRK